MKKYLISDLVSHLVLIALLVLSVIHAEERIIHLDSAGYVFDMINNPFHIITYRISSWLILLFISLLVSIKASIASIVLLSSVFYGLIPYTFYLLVRYVYNIQYYSILIPFGSYIGALLCFYYPVTEVFIATYLFLSAFLIQEFGSWKSWEGYVIWGSIPLMHPLLIPAGVSYLLFRQVYGKRSNKQLVVFSTGLLASLLFSSSSGEKAFYEQLLFLSERLNFWETPPFQFLIGHLGTYSWKYINVLVMFVIILVFTLRQSFNQYIRVMWGFLTILIYFILVGAIYYEGESALILEKSILPVTMILALLVITTVPAKSWTPVIVFLMMGYQIREMALQIKNQEKRLGAIASLVSKAREQEGQKFLIAPNTITTDISIPWALSVETLLFSSLDGQKQCTICPNFEGANLERFEGEKVMFLFPYKLEISQEKLNSSYFQIDGRYRSIKE